MAVCRVRAGMAVCRVRAGMVVVGSLRVMGGVSVLRNELWRGLLQGEDKAIVEAAGGVYEWCWITFFIEIMVVIEFIVRGYIHESAIVIPFMGDVHEMRCTRVGLEVLRGVFLKQARE
ncbi:hypothetical protein [Bartonella sp. AP9QHHD]|uniref:hypothetical protein n=1 Tax=Bartonella sp. AP9QHHD TaxID=3243507 RepID=UPI0035CFC0D8